MNEMEWMDQSDCYAIFINLVRGRGVCDRGWCGVWVVGFGIGGGGVWGRGWCGVWVVGFEVGDGTGCGWWGLGLGFWAGVGDGAGFGILGDGPCCWSGGLGMGVR